MTTDIQNEKNHVFNIGLAKCTGLYQILDPGTVKFLGRNVYHIALAFILLYICVISMILNVSGVYYWTINMPISIDYFWKAGTALFTIYKIWIVVRNSDEIWNCLSITWYGCTSSAIGNRHKNNNIILDGWRERLMWLTTMYAYMYTSSSVIYAASTLVFNNSKLPVKNHDGSVGNYRQNIMNLYIFVSDETYNAHYGTFYVVELLFLAMLTLIFLIFDTLVVTLCYAICGQMQTICSAFESVGHVESICDPLSQIDITEEKKNICNEQDLIYNELKTIIMDHQIVMKKYEDFLALFGRVMLLQIFVSSLSLIILWFILIMSFSNDDRFNVLEVVIKKMMSSIPSIMFQLFMMYYFFDNLHSQKDSIIFALYSSNWTEMDMKCKKLILLTMRMNNANGKKLKFTRTKVVCLKMFFKTMGDCYTIISVLINYIKTNGK